MPRLRWDPLGLRNGPVKKPVVIGKNWERQAWFCWVSRLGLLWLQLFGFGGLCDSRSVRL